MSNCINSSKVYCKSIYCFSSCLVKIVLIVAKCIVNMTFAYGNNQDMEVLIVAKCIVNIFYPYQFIHIDPVLIVAKCIVNNGSGME